MLNCIHIKKLAREPVQNERQKYVTKFSHNFSDSTFLFDNSATGHFSRKFPPDGTPSGHTGSNDIGLKSVWSPGVESIPLIHTQNKNENTEYTVYIDNSFWKIIQN